jgi:hypothetical protein
MIAVKHIIQYMSSHFIKNLLLCALGIKYIIKHERNLLFSWIFDDELAFMANSMYFIGISCEFFGVEGPKPTEDFYISLCFLLHLACYYLIIKQKKSACGKNIAFWSIYFLFFAISFII